jgi:hypothetical protein
VLDALVDLCVGVAEVLHLADAAGEPRVTSPRRRRVSLGIAWILIGAATVGLWRGFGPLFTRLGAWAMLIVGVWAIAAFLTLVLTVASPSSDAPHRAASDPSLPSNER